MGWTQIYNAGPTREEITRVYQGDPDRCAECAWGPSYHPRIRLSEYDAIYGPRDATEPPHDFRPYVPEYRVLDYARVGWSEVYLAVETLVTHDVWAGMCIVHRYRDGSLTYKDMDERMGPYYYRCPARILDRLTPTNEPTSNEWRQKCRDYHAARLARPKVHVGDRVRFAEPLEFSDGYVISGSAFVAPGSVLRRHCCRPTGRSTRPRPCMFTESAG